MLDVVGYTVHRPLHTKTIVEPSVGGSAFVVPLVERLATSAASDGIALESLHGAVRGFDIRTDHVLESRRRIEKILRRCGAGSGLSRDLAHTWIREADFLLDDEDLQADFVVGNPPYIRADDLDGAREHEYRRRWSTMRGRADIYVGFYERSLSILKPSGRLAFICADRWMRNAYGATLRRMIAENFSVDQIWQMHEVRAFENVVAAYPAITVLSNRKQGRTVVAEASKDFSRADAEKLREFALSQRASTRSINFSASRVRYALSGSDLWPAGDPRTVAIVESVAQRFGRLEQARNGTKIGIGVATGADAVFVADDATADVESSRKLPLAMTKDLEGGSFNWHEKVLLNPWEEDGSLVDLAEYPLLAATYERSKATINDRFVARRNPESWFRTIDKVDSKLTGRPKLLIPELKASIQPVLEPGGHYPHHGLYYITSDTWDLKVLGGILLSRVAQAFIETYCVRMRGGTLRFQAQYLRQIRVPDPDSIPASICRDLAAAFDSRDASAATVAAVAAYDLPRSVLKDLSASQHGSGASAD